MATRRGPSRSYVALLRGINVAGKHRLPMRELVDLFEQAGCQNVTTYIQSGNVLFHATASLAKKLSRVIAAGIEDAYGFEAPVVLRSGEELQAVARSHPYAKAPIEQLHVAFLANVPSAAQARALDPDRSPPDELTLRGRELFLRCPNGIGKSKLTTSFFDRTLGTVTTVRNQKTVLQLAELSKG